MQRLFSFMLPALLVAAAPDGPGRALPAIPTLAPQAPSSGIVATADGTVYFADAYHGTVWRARASDGVTAFVTNRRTRTLQLDAAGNIYGSTQDGRRAVLWRADAVGNVTELKADALPEEVAHAFAIGSGGEVLGWTRGERGSGARLWRARQHARDLVTDADVGVNSASRLGAVGGMASTDTGELVVTSGAAVLRICREGNITTLVADHPLLRPRQGLLSRMFGDAESHLSGVAVGAAGEVYVANTQRAVVLRVDDHGNAREVHASEAGWRPTGVAYAGGALYVLEYGNGVRVQRVMDGAASVIVSVRSPRALAQSPFMSRLAI